MKIFLITPGEAVENIHNLFVFDSYGHLTANGQAQVKKLAKQLKRKKVGVLYCNPKRSVVETAVILYDRLGCELRITESLRNCDLCPKCPTNFVAYFSAGCPWELIIEDRFNSSSNPETYDSLKDRIIPTFKALACSGYSTAIGIIMDEGPVKCILKEVFGLDQIIKIDPCALIELESDGSTIKIVNAENAQLSVDYRRLPAIEIF